MKDAPVDKLRISVRIKSIAVEAFGRHLKRVDASALFLFACKIRPVKTYIPVGNRLNCGCFLPACNFTDALLFSLNSLRFVGKGLTGTGLFPTVPTVMRPCDGTSGLVRGNRRKAVFAFKGCFPVAFVAGIHGSHGLCSHYFSRKGVFDESLLSLAVI